MKIKLEKKLLSNNSELDKKTLKTSKVHTKQAVKFNSYHTNSEVPKKSSISYIFYFFFVVFIAILIGFSWKTFTVYQKSTFNSESFAVFINQKDNAHVVSVKNDGIVILTGQFRNNLKDPFSYGYAYGIPIDAMITIPDFYTDPFTVLSFKTIFSSLRNKISFSHMTIFDAIKMISKNSGISAENKKIQKVTITDNVLDLDNEELLFIFKDRTIISEGLSVEIVNATLTNGLAGNVANMMRPLGVNIVSLKSDKIVSESHVLAAKKSKTTQRISRMLAIPVQYEDHASIADIIVVLGEDFEKRISP